MGIFMMAFHLLKTNFHSRPANWMVKCEKRSEWTDSLHFCGLWKCGNGNWKSFLRMESCSFLDACKERTSPKSWLKTLVCWDLHKLAVLTSQVNSKLTHFLLFFFFRTWSGCRKVGQKRTSHSNQITTNHLAEKVFAANVTLSHG